jgi:hypothetical protein
VVGGAQEMHTERLNSLAFNFYLLEQITIFIDDGRQKQKNRCCEKLKGSSGMGTHSLLLKKN